MKVFVNGKLAYADAEPMRRLLAKAKGLMFSSSVKKPLVFFFDSAGREKNSIHSFFCPRFDAVFISQDGVVVDVFQDISPNTLIRASEPVLFLIETFPGDAEKKGFKLGARVSFE